MTVKDSLRHCLVCSAKIFWRGGRKPTSGLCLSHCAQVRMFMVRRNIGFEEALRVAREKWELLEFALGASEEDWCIEVRIVHSHLLSGLESE